MWRSFKVPGRLLLSVLCGCFLQLFPGARAETPYKAIQFGSVQNDSLIASITDQENNLFVAGALDLALEGQSGIAMVQKYNAELKLVWQTAIDSEAEEAAIDLALGKNDELFVIGYTTGELAEYRGEADLFLSQLDANTGEIIWTRQLGTSKDDYPKDLFIDHSDNLYVAGLTRGSFEIDNQGDFDGFVLKLDALGNLKWVKQFGTIRFDAALSLATNGEDKLFVLTRDNQYQRARAMLEVLSFDGELLSRVEVGKVDTHADLLYSEYHGKLFIATKSHQCSHSNCRMNRSVVELFSFGDALSSLDKLWLSDWEVRFSFYPVRLIESSSGYLYMGTSILTEENERDILLNKYDAQSNLLRQKSFGTVEGDSLETIVMMNENLIVAGTTSGAFGGENLGMGDAFILQISE